MKLILTLLLTSLGLFAQATHSVTLNWVDTSNPTTTTYNVYRATGLCSGSPVYSKIGTGVALKTYEDTTVQPGPYCYVVTATYSSIESAYSNSALANVPSFAPTSLSVIVK